MKRFLMMAATLVLTTSCRSSYDALTVYEFINNCRRQGGTTEACACALEKVQRQYTQDEYERIDLRVRLGEALPDTIVDAMVECVKVQRKGGKS